MRGTGEMMAGRMATRSVTRALSNKGSQDPLSSLESDQLLQKSKVDSNVFADMTGSKGAKRRRFGSNFTEDPYDGTEDLYDFCLPALKLWNTKKGLKEVKKTKMEFDKWVAEHGRKYESKKEREKRLLAFSDNKRRIDAFNKVKPGCWTDGYNLDNMDKFFWEN